MNVDIDKWDDLDRKTKEVAASVDRYQRELAEILKDGINDDEFKKLDEINGKLHAAANKLGEVTEELRRMRDS